MTPRVIAHTTDLTGDDRAGFVHAAALAAAGGVRLITVHGNAPLEETARLPDAAPLAARWQRTIDHQRVCHECCDDVTDTLLDALARIHPALVVTGTHARHGLSAVFHASVSEALARNLDVPTLVVPNHGRGFVDEATGAIDLGRILIPAADATTAAIGVAAVNTLTGLAGLTGVEVVLLHVGADELTMPTDAIAAGARVVRGRGRLEDVIVSAARDQQACAIVMPTHGHDGIADALLGSHTDHVIRDAGCPVLAVPVKVHAEG